MSTMLMTRLCDSFPRPRLLVGLDTDGIYRPLVIGHDNAIVLPPRTVCPYCRKVRREDGRGLCVECGAAREDG